jgi:murein DD-endopeptidase MepM/ murein hydrolase activator NlpD
MNGYAGFTAKRGWTIAVALIAPLALSACADSSKTYFDWNVRETATTHAKKTATRAKYVYNDRKNAGAAPKQAPGWYTNSGSDCCCKNPAPAKPAAGNPQNYTPAPAGNGYVRFSWPVSGQVIEDFGTDSSGQRNDGINIAVPYDTPIRAAAAGTVSYVGSELKNYGNLLLIQHQGNYVTAYAHADRLLVKRGDTVSAGQIIGYSGDTGDVSRPQLHFEIRRGVTPINPRQLLVASS